MTEQPTQELVVVGSGVAGLSAAVYAARADLDPLVLEGEEPGGQLTLTTDVENFLGFPEGVGGMELIQRGREQAERFGAEFRRATVVGADLDGRPFELSLPDGETVRTKALVIATGAGARWVGADGEERLMGHGLSTCATCDGAFHRGNDVLVVGGGDSAMEEALFLTKFADRVTVVHRHEELRASEIMVDRARDEPAIDFRWNTEVVELHGDESTGLTSAALVSHPGGHPSAKLAAGEDVHRETVDVQGVFYAVGHEPNTGFLEDTPVELDADGHVVTDPGTTATTVDGVFAAGDVADDRYRQAITAAGTGSQAALDAEAWLDSQLEAVPGEVASA